MSEASIAATGLAVAAPPRRGLIRRLAATPGVLIPAIVLLVLIVIAVAPGAVAGLFGHGNPLACDLAQSAAAPSAGHPFGRDVQGCDLYANVVYGTRSSLAIGVLTTAMSAIVAVVVGTLAGLFGGILDVIISRITDIFLGFPFLLGAIILLSAFPARTVWSVSVALAVFSWPLLARLIRSGVRSVKSAEFVLAARAMGLNPLRVVTRYILANSLSPLIVVGTILVGSVIVAESSLTYLGIGLQAPAISWGLQLANAQSQFQSHPHLLIAPAVFLAITVLSIITLGDGLRRALDPKRNRR